MTHMSTPTKTGSLYIKHPNTSLRVNLRGNRIYITMATGGSKATMALTPEEALAVSSYIQAKAQAILSRGTYIGIRSATTTNKASKTGKKVGKKPEAKEETATAPKQVEPETGGEGEEDIGEE